MTFNTPSREKSLARYLSALELGNIVGTISILEQAERNVILERMILDVHETCQVERDFPMMVQEEKLTAIDSIHKSDL